MKARTAVFMVLAALGAGLFVWHGRELRETATEMKREHEGRLSDDAEEEEEAEQSRAVLITAPVISTPAGSEAVEQTQTGNAGTASLVASFDGLGFGFQGPHGTANFRNPSDNSLAIGPNHVFQIVNSRMAIYTKQGKVLYGPVNTNSVFKDFGGACEANNNGDAVVRYDQLAGRWLVVMPVFRRGEGVAGEPTLVSRPGRPDQPGGAVPLFSPPPSFAPPPGPPPQRGAAPQGASPGPPPRGPYSMCYAVSATADPMGAYYRYEFIRPLFPDYPRPAIWPDGYYVPTSSGDEVIEKHVCVAERARMLKGESASEQCVVIKDVNFLNSADLDGKNLPPVGAPNIILAAGGTQLKKIFADDGIFAWKFHVDWKTPAKTKLTGPEKIAVAPYHYLCDGQLTNCVPQPGTESRLDAQGDKIMARVVYRRLGNRESIVAVHSVNTSAGGGGVRWYEFRIDPKTRDVGLKQQGTYAPDGFYRWMASPAIDKLGNIGIGYSFGGSPNFAGQRFTGRLSNDPPGRLTLRETMLVEGQGIQNAMRWEDFSQTALDPADDCTIWYVGDYIHKDETAYRSRIGAFQLPGCH
jgi:hypothetical protein